MLGVCGDSRCGGVVIRDSGYRKYFWVVSPELTDGEHEAMFRSTCDEGINLSEVPTKNGDTRPFTDSDSLILSGRLQSVEVLEIVVFLEENFGMDFSEGFDQAWLDSVDEIVKRCERSAKIAFVLN